MDIESGGECRRDISEQDIGKGLDISLCLPSGLRSMVEIALCHGPSVK